MHIIRIKYTKMWHHLPALFIWSWLVQSYIFVTIRNQFKNWIIMCQVSKEFSKFLWNVIGFISKIAKDCRRASVLSTTMWIVTRRIYGFVADYVISTLFNSLMAMARPWDVREWKWKGILYYILWNILW